VTAGAQSILVIVEYVYRDGPAAGLGQTIRQPAIAGAEVEDCGRGAAEPVKQQPPQAGEAFATDLPNSVLAIAGLDDRKGAIEVSGPTAISVAIAHGAVLNQKRRDGGASGLR
jgi:hypothetical protein